MGEVNNEYGFTCPDDLTPQEFRRHPISEMLAATARGYKLATDALAELGVKGEALEKVKKGAEEARRLKGMGSQQQAREVAKQAAAEAIAELPDQRAALEPDTPDPLADASPEELAAEIGRL
jgi:hypothetical protein